MRKKAILAILLSCGMVGTALAQEDTTKAQPVVEVTVAHIVFGTGIENREATGVDSSFTSDVGRIFCWTLITGASGETEVSHVWYHNNEEMAKVTLPVRSPRWRTYSSKGILPEWTGAWRVDVVDTSGQVLKSSGFEVK